jgi:NarL family two-component system sensor histidine kinase LiaS
VQRLAAAGTLVERDELLGGNTCTPQDRIALAPEWIQGAIAVPGRDRTLALLILGHKTGASFYDPIDLIILRILVSVVGLMLENSRAFLRLRRARQQVTRTAAAERRRLARILHDDIIQGLHVIAYEMVAWEDKVLSADDVERLRIKHLTLIQSLRDLCADLRSTSEQDGVSLAEAMNILVTHVRSQAPITSRLEFDNPGNVGVPSAVAESALGILKEALTNVGHHSGATAVDVQVRVDAAGMTLRIADNGQGFDVGEARERAEKTSHFGLLGLNEQAEAVGGVVLVDSERGRGTLVQAQLPFEGDDNDTHV